MCGTELDEVAGALSSVVSQLEEAEYAVLQSQASGGEEYVHGFLTSCMRITDRVCEHCIVAALTRFTCHARDDTQE